jgi:DHA1 family solute carrier family 18 vesicular amine transporter 1/2
MMLTQTMSIGAFPVLLPDLGRAGGLADWQLGIVAGAFGFARMVADIPIGLFITHHLRRAVAVSPFLLALGLLLLATDGPWPLLAVARALMGLAHALGVVSGLTAILRFQATGRLASALSAYELSAMLGILGATVVLGLLPTSLPWNVALLITCIPQVVGLVLIPLVLTALPPEPRGAGQPLFARRSATLPAPITSGVVVAFAAGGAIAITYSTLEQFVIPLRADREFGLSRSGIAGLLMTVQACDIICLLPTGVLADRHGAARVLGVMLIAFAAGTTLIEFAAYPGLIAGCVLFGLGMASWTLPLGVLRWETPPEHVGWRTAVYRVGVDGGMFLGPFLSGFLTARAPGLLPGVLAVALLVIAVVLLRRRGPGA